MLQKIKLLVLYWIIYTKLIKNIIDLVASAGLEPARDKSHWILSPDCLPFQHEANRMCPLISLQKVSKLNRILI